MAEASWETRAMLLRYAMQNNIVNEEIVETVFALTEMRDVGSLNDEQAALLQVTIEQIIFSK